MHVYIYDGYTGEKKYEQILAQIETRITDLGLNGKITRLKVIKNTRSAIENEIKQGAKTLIAVGDNQTLSKTVNALMKYEDNNNQTDIPVGFIPIDKKADKELIDFLGLSAGVEACDFLSARRIEKIDVGKIGNDYFLWEAVLPSENILKIKENLEIQTDKKSTTKAINWDVFEELPPETRKSPQDGLLNLYIKPGKQSKFFKKNSSDFSLFSIKNLFIKSPKPSTIDQRKQINGPAELSVFKKRLNIIVGKNRRF